MKKIILASVVLSSMLFGTSFAAEPANPTTPAKPAEMQSVCIDEVTKDGKPVLDKAGKPVKKCRNMRVHNKLEGTKIPAKGETK